MKIIVLTTDLEIQNGWGRYSLETIKRLNHNLLEPYVFIGKGAPIPPGISLKVFPVLRSYSDNRFKLITIFLDFLYIKKIMKNYSCVHCFAEPFIPLAWLLSLNKKKLILNAVGTYSISWVHSKWKLLYSLAFKKAEIIPCISQYVAKRFAASFPDLKTKLKVIPLGVDASQSPVNIKPAHDREKAFLTVGQVKSRKGTLELIQALKIVREKHSDIHLYIAGSISNKGYVEKVKNLITEYDLNKNVSWLGSINDSTLENLYSKVRGLVMPSMNVGDSFEGFGLVHLEANRFGVPSIGSRDTGNEEAIKDGHSGFLIVQGDIQQLSYAMLKLIDDDKTWSKLSKQALEHAKEMSWEKAAERYNQIYEYNT